MRRLKLLFTAFALLLGWSSAWADEVPSPGDDMTSLINNPNITGNADGWVITGEARYYNGKGFDGTASFIELCNWGSSWDATISQTVTSLPNGYYKVQAAGQMSGNSDTWMKLVANGAESYFSRNGDTNGNILADGTETTIGSGVAGWRYTRVIAKVTDGTLAISCVGHSDVKERWANFDAVTLTYLGSEIAPNTDVTEFINNWDFLGCFNDAFNGWTIEKTGGNSWVHGNSAVEHWSNDLSRTFDFYQNISGLPEGRYEISASMWNTQGSGPNGNSGVYGTSNEVTAFAGVTDDCGDNNLHTYSTEIFINNGELRIGVKNNGDRSAFWFGVDWIKLNYKGKVVRDYAVALPEGGAMAADTWYYFDIAAAADNYSATATTLGDIICVADGYALESTTEGTVTLKATDNSFAAQRYYVKSSTNNNLVIAVASYSYNVSAATADKAYVQPSQTVTVSYTVSTNNPNATLAQDYSGVTFNGIAINVTPGENGFTFTTPANLEVNTEYTLSIPANAIGYSAGSTYNEAQEITLTTPVIFDGTYFLKVANETAAKDKYLARGSSYGTHATLDKYGLPIIVTTDGSNATTMQAADSKLYYFHGNSWDCWADKSSAVNEAKFTITLNNGKYRIHNNVMPDGTYLKYNDSAVNDAVIPVYDDGTGSNSGPILEWAIESANEHATAMQNLKDSQAAAAATAAYASGNYESLNGITTVADLKAELTANYIQGDFVSASEISSVQEKYQGGQPGSDNVSEIVYSNTINITEPGFYKFSMQAFYRLASNANTQALHEANFDFPPVVLFFGDSETQIKSVYDESSAEQLTTEWDNFQYNGAYYPNGVNSSLTAFKNDMYHNDVWFYCSTPGTYTYGVKYMGWASVVEQWFIYSPESVTVTSYAAAADDADYTALSEAIDYVKANYGFEEGEYAPYAMIEPIAEVNAFIKDHEDNGTVNSKILVNSKAADLKAATNATEVNAFYGGDFTKYQTVHNETDNRDEDYPYGWDLYHGDSNRSRIMGGTEGTSNTGLSAASSGKALLIKFNATYGESEGYTMPLKAGKIYKITFKYGGWNNTPNTIVSLTDPSDAAITLAPNFKPASNDAHSNAEHWYNYTGYFASTTTGNYTLHFNKVESGQQQIIIADIDLRTAEYIEFADNAVPYYAPATYPSVKITRALTADRWATAIYPFAVTGVDNIAVLDSYNAATGTLGFSTAAASVANEPFLMKSASDKSEISLSNVEVSAADDTTPVVENEAKLIGTYSQITVTNAEKNYVLSENKIRPASSEGATINPYRAYIQVDQPDQPGEEARMLTFFVDGETTGISATLNDNEQKDKVVFNLNGQRVQKAQKGIYIINGKKTVVK